MALDSAQDRHRPGALKQQNKAHKHGRHRSKGAIDNAMKGRTSAKTFTKKARHELRKVERKNKAAQIRQKKRDEILLKKRSMGGETSAPLLIAIVPLCSKLDATRALELLRQADDEAVVTRSREGVTHISSPRLKQRFSIVMTIYGGLFSTLDALKAADITLFLISARHPDGIDALGQKMLMSCQAQGLPSTIVAVTNLENLMHTEQRGRMQNLQKVISYWLPDQKVMNLSRYNDGLAVLRRAGSRKQRYIKYRSMRPYILAEVLEYIPDDQGPLGTLKATGYVRGQPLCVNSLVHIPGWGDFQMSRIDASDDPHPLEKRSKGNRQEVRTRSINDMVYERERILEIADPGKQESLQTENIPDPMESEQTWPTEEELVEAEEESRVIKRKIKKVPRGMSEYQAAWIPDSDAEEVDINEDDEYGMNIDVDGSSEESSSEGEHAEEGECDTVTVTEFGADAEQYDENMDFAEEEEALKKIKEAQMDQLFPDERDTPQNIPARIRFQKYRGLKSFRTSPWDPKENLPSEYARIFQFENFDRTRKRIMEEEDKEGALPGWYITIHVVGVPEDVYKLRGFYHPIVLFGLLPHEQKMSLLNIVMRRPNIVRNEQEIITSKEELVFHCGYRRFKACPIFSQHSNGTKHKYERFFQPESAVVASVFAPIMFPPAPVLVYQEKRSRIYQELVAVGHLLSVNPDRIVAKRVVLSGYLLKVLKRSAIVRFMFFNREDIEWFKPVELRTKYGRRGHIKEPLGTHGHMKCVFDGQLKSQDTVLMNLYKRVFPKWTYKQRVPTAPTMYNINS